MATDDKDALDNFLTTTLARQFEAEQALINGDPRPRLALTSTGDPVTVFGAKVPLRRGWDEVSGTLRWLASRWSNGTDYRFELVAAGVSEDLAYVIGFEHIENSVKGVPVEPYTLRVTHIYRRENDEWRIAHRHADYVPIDQTLPSQTSQPQRARVKGRLIAALSGEVMGRTAAADASRASGEVRSDPRRGRAVVKQNDKQTAGRDDRAHRSVHWCLITKSV